VDETQFIDAVCVVFSYTVSYTIRILGTGINIFFATDIIFRLLTILLFKLSRFVAVYAT
jgi:hypothetical protein